MRWDPERYRLEVLEPARRAGNVPPQDLYLRYWLPRDISDPRAFAERITEVLAYWQTLKSRRAFARLAETLIAKHAELERAGRLTPAKFVELQAHSHHKDIERLTALAATEAGTATHVGPVALARLRGAVGGSVTEAEVREALRQAGVRVVEEFPELPARPHRKLADLVQHVELLGLRLSPEVVFGDALSVGIRVLGGFRLADGRLLTEAAINEARRGVDALPHTNPTKTTRENVLAILRGAVRDSAGSAGQAGSAGSAGQAGSAGSAELNTLLLSEITERLRPLAESGFAQRAIAAQARDLGLTEDEAGLIAAAMLARDTAETVRQQAETELAGGRLRSAQRLAASLPADDPLRQTISAREAEVADLARRAETELIKGRTEQAARLLYEAMTMASDDAHLPERLAALPPPPPRSVAARVDGDHVLVTWQASPVLAGQVHYRVMRGEGRAPASAAEGTAVVTQTERQDVTDTEAPPGAGLFYSVFASRGNTGNTGNIGNISNTDDIEHTSNIWSPPAVTQSVMFAPDVTELSVETGETSVALSWRVHPATDTVLAVRAEGRPPRGPDDGTVVEASLAGLTDAGLRTGTEYFYRIAASYRTPSGQRRASAGVVVPVQPTPAPEPVTRLEVLAGDGTAPDGTGLTAAWQPPRYGQVRLALSDKPPRWRPGTRLTHDEVAGLRQVQGIPIRGADGRDFIELDLPPGRHYLIALTAGGRTVVAGDAAEIGLAAPVRDLSAQRMRDVVRLSFVWPEDATDAVIRWPGGEQRCSRRVYEDEGGVTLDVGQAGADIEVRAVYSHPGGELTAPGVRTTVPGRGVALNYRIFRPSRLHPRQRVVEIAAEQPTTLPALVVVRTTGRYAPDDPGEGEAVARIEPQSIAPGEPVKLTLELPKGPAWLACFIDPDADGVQGAHGDQGTQGVLLFPPTAEEMRIR